VSLARRYDADDADSLFGPDDQLTVFFSMPTDLGGYALGTTLTRGTIDGWIAISPPLAAEINYTGVWISATRLNITFHSVPAATMANVSLWPSAIACVCRASVNGRCRDANGLHAANKSAAGELSCLPQLVPLDPTSDWGARPGPSIVSVTAADEDMDPDNLADGFYSSNDTIDVLFNQPTNLGSLQLGVAYGESVVNSMFDFFQTVAGADVPVTLGSSFSGTWRSNRTFRIRAINIATPDSRPLISSINADFSVRCRPNGPYPIRDAALLSLPSTCFSVRLLGSFGANTPPILASITASDPDNADGTLSAGDVILVEWTRGTDRGMCAVCTDSSPPVDVPDGLLEGALQLVSFSVPAPATGAAVALNLSLTGTWLTCRTLRLTVGRTPRASEVSPGSPGYITDGANLTVRFSGRGGQCGAGVRNVFSTSPAVLLSDVVVGGNFGNRTGPTLLSAFANDADDADAVISANDTLILTFSEPTNQAGYPAGQLLPSSWVAAALDAPPAPASAWQAVWINATKLRLTVVNASGVDLVAWGATVGPTDLALTAMVGVLPGAAIRNAAFSSLPASTTVRLSGNWGTLPGPRPTALRASAGGAVNLDAVYSNLDMIEIQFSEATDRGGHARGEPLNASQLSSMLSCRYRSWRAPLTYPATPLPLSAFGQLRAQWYVDDVLTLTVVDASSASPLFLTPTFGPPPLGGDGAMIQRLQCSITSDGRVRNRAGTSRFASGDTSALEGDWGSLLPPRAINMTLDVGGIDMITIDFDAPTDRGGVPLRWPIPHRHIAPPTIQWRRYHPTTNTYSWNEIGLYSIGQGRWESDRRLVIEVVEQHPNATLARSLICQGLLQARLYTTLNIRNAARTSRAAEGFVVLGGGGCGQGRSPAVFAAGHATDGALGLPAAARLTCSAANAGHLTSSSPELRALTATSGFAVSALAASSGGQGKGFSMVLLEDGSVYTWGSRIVGAAGERIEGPRDRSPDIFPGSRDHLVLPAPAPGAPAGSAVRAIAIAAGCAHALVLLSDGRVCGFGADDEGQLAGAPSAANATLAAFVTCHLLPSTLPRMRKIACGCSHSLLVAAESDALYAFGASNAGQLGRPAGSSAFEPIQSYHPHWLPARGAYANVSIVGVAAGRDHSVAWLASGAVCTWGFNDYGQLGPVYEGAGNSSGAQLIVTFAGRTSAACFNVTDEGGEPVRVAHVAAGQHHTLALTATGRVFAWGDPAAAVGATAATASAAGVTLQPSHVPQRPLEMWGYSSSSSASASSAPPRGTYVYSIGAGGAHSVATTARGEVWTWGNNRQGQLGSGCTTNLPSGGPYAPRRAPSSPSWFVSTRSWRTVADRTPTSLARLDLTARLNSMLTLLPALGLPVGEASSMAGLEAPCYAACEAQAAAAAAAAGTTGAAAVASCAAFTFPVGGTLPSQCVFYAATAGASRSVIATVSALPSNPNSLYILEEREQGGARLSAAGGTSTDAAFTLVAVGMVGAERCPPAGELQLPCGGPQRGACVLGLCVCNAAWQGDACDSCGTECVHGTCALDPVSQMPSCVNCDMGFRGPSCSDLDCPRWPLTDATSTSSNCAGHGLGPADGCYQRSGASGTFACACAPGWQGTSCQLPDCSVGLDNCNGFSRGLCKCRSTIDGSDLGFACAGANTTAQCVCSDGHAGPTCNVTCPVAPNGQRCGGHGVCRTMGGVPQCMCDGGWGLPPGGTARDACTHPVCPGFGTPSGECSSNGVCNSAATGATGATCICNAGFEGDDCGDPLCPSIGLAGPCTGHGLCRLSTEGGQRLPVCQCDYGWSGTACQNNFGLNTLIIALSVASGLIFITLIICVALYCRGKGAKFNAVDAYRRRVWERSGTHSSSLGFHGPVFMPTRVVGVHNRIVPTWIDEPKLKVRAATASR